MWVRFNDLDDFGGELWLGFGLKINLVDNEMLDSYNIASLGCAEYGRKFINGKTIILNDDGTVDCYFDDDNYPIYKYVIFKISGLRSNKDFRKLEKCDCYQTYSRNREEISDKMIGIFDNYKDAEIFFEQEKSNCQTYIKKVNKKNRTFYDFIYFKLCRFDKEGNFLTSCIYYDNYINTDNIINRNLWTVPKPKNKE